jgi:hypothetical protein
MYTYIGRRLLKQSSEPALGTAPARLKPSLPPHAPHSPACAAEERIRQRGLLARRRHSEGLQGGLEPQLGPRRTHSEGFQGGGFVPAEVSIRQHTSAYVSAEEAKRTHSEGFQGGGFVPAEVSIRQHTSAYVSAEEAKRTHSEGFQGGGLVPVEEEEAKRTHSEGFTGGQQFFTGVTGAVFGAHAVGIGDGATGSLPLFVYLFIFLYFFIFFLACLVRHPLFSLPLLVVYPSLL